MSELASNLDSTADYDVVVVGSGFGGSVAALRLTEKGYRVAVLEAGRRFADDEFARTSWDLRRYLWAPRVGCYGIQRISLLRLDGDMYESTHDALDALYPRLSPGGYLVVDDYGARAPCREAVDDFRNRHRVNEPIHEIDWTGVYWQRLA